MKIPQIHFHANYLNQHEISQSGVYICSEVNLNLTNVYMENFSQHNGFIEKCCNYENII